MAFDTTREGRGRCVEGLLSFTRQNILGFLLHTTCIALCICLPRMASFQVGPIEAEARQQTSQRENKHRANELGQARS